MSQPIIGLTIGPAKAGDPYLELRRTYPRAVEAAGGIPVLIPPLESESALQALLERLDGVLLPGGVDVDPALYGEPRHPTTDVDPVKDAHELAVIRWAARSQLPVLGICRGQQILNVAFGGSLIQHLDSHPQSGKQRAATPHTISLAEGSRLGAIMGAATCDVNSLHHQAIERLGSGLHAVAWAPDGTIEGVESDEHPWLLAVQFHPEDLIAFHNPSQRLFQAFIEAATVRLSAVP